MQPEKIDWQSTKAAVWRGKQRKLRAVRDLDSLEFADLLNIERQKQEFCSNLERFLAGKPRNHVLLWGSRGTGKSSIVKAALNQYHSQGLRVVEIEKQDIQDLTEISDQLRDLPFRFVIFCDDLSFDAADNSFRYLKVLMEGSIELPPENIILIATSNRRHLIAETHADNQGAKVGASGVLHYGDLAEEKMSLADRFGLSLSFYPPTQDEYLAIIDQLFADFAGDKATLHQQAINFATQRGSRSGRIARQFHAQYQ